MLDLKTRQDAQDAESDRDSRALGDFRSNVGCYRAAYRALHFFKPGKLAAWQRREMTNCIKGVKAQIGEE
jgi:hypothetical protein